MPPAKGCQVLTTILLGGELLCELEEVPGEWI